MTDTSIVRLLLKENFRDIYDALEETGGILYLNNTINKWLLSIFTQGMSDRYALLIWDMFLLEGNIVVFKTIYALIYILEKHIIKCTNFDELNNVFNEVPLNLNQRANLAYYLISKKFNFNMDLIRKYRKTLSPQIIKEIEGLGTFSKATDENEENAESESKKIVCDLDWPICLNDKKDLSKEYDHIVLKQLNEPVVIDNYFNFEEENKIKNNNKKKYDINNEKDEEKIKYYKEKAYEDLLIERRKHYCGSKLMSIRADLYKSSNKFEKIESEHLKKRKSSLNIFFDNNEDESKNIDKRNEAINKIVIDVSNQNQRLLSFVKEDVEKSIKLIEDDKI
jgi:hypothetical protein